MRVARTSNSVTISDLPPGDINSIINFAREIHKNYTMDKKTVTTQKKYTVIVKTALGLFTHILQDTPDAPALYTNSGMKYLVVDTLEYYTTVYQ